jgi:uncharacterized RDD family membrane protein YckC
MSADALTGPASGAAGLPRAGLGRRLCALVYEALLLAAVVAVGFFLPHILLGSLAHVVFAGRILIVHLFLLLLVYYVWFWTHGGQTLAMKTWNIRLVDRSGRPPRLLQAVLRYFAAWPSLLCCGLGVLWAVFDREGQFLHDRIADTRLVRVTPAKATPTA